MRKAIFIYVNLVLFSCGEKLIQKPENIIAKEKMIEVLADMAIANAAKTTNTGLIIENKIDPTEYVFNKHQIDSAQFVDSDRFYASVPAEYESIYTAVELKLEHKKNELEEAKKLKDSLQRLQIEADRKIKDSVSIKVKTNDSLL